MKKNTQLLSSDPSGHLTVVKKTDTAEQIRSAYLKAILSGTRLISGTEKATPIENPDKAAAIRYIKDSSKQHRKY